jgi:hypothetical protein
MDCSQGVRLGVIERSFQSESKISVKLRSEVLSTYREKMTKTPTVNVAHIIFCQLCSAYFG